MKSSANAGSRAWRESGATISHGQEKQHWKDLGPAPLVILSSDFMEASVLWGESSADPSLESPGSIWTVCPLLSGPSYYPGLILHASGAALDHSCLRTVFSSVLFSSLLVFGGAHPPVTLWGRVRGKSIFWGLACLKMSILPSCLIGSLGIEFQVRNQSPEGKWTHCSIVPSFYHCCQEVWGHSDSWKAT